MSTDASPESDTRHVSGSINLTDEQLANHTGGQNPEPTIKSAAQPADGPDGMALAAETLFDLDGRVMRGARLLQGVNTKRLRSLVHADLSTAKDFPISRGTDLLRETYSEVQKTTGLLAAAVDQASDSDTSVEISQLLSQVTSILLQTRAVLARRDGENVGTPSGDPSGE